MAKFKAVKQTWATSKNEIGIYIRITMNRKISYLPTGFSVAPNDWNDKRNEVRKTHPLHLEINRKLQDMITVCKDTEIQLITQNILPSFEHYQNAFTPTSTQKELFTDYFTRKIESRRVSTETKQTYRNTLRLFKEFKACVNFTEINYKLLTEFDSYLMTQSFKKNTLGKHHTVLRAFINEAIKEDLLEKNPYKKGFKVPREKSNRIALTISEVRCLEELAFDDDARYLEKYRDAYLFCCYTGLRFGDMAKLHRSQFIINGNKMDLEIVTQKSKRLIYLPLNTLYNGKPKEMILKYWSLELPNIFPKMTNQKFNFYIKEIGKLANIKKHLTHHVARHTFGTIGASLMPFGVLKELMAHSKPETTAIYVKMTKEHIDNGLNKVNWND
jgi:site-specific recombinase XerD